MYDVMILNDPTFTRSHERHTMDYAALFDTVRQHLESLAIATEIISGAVATDDAIAQLEATIGCRLPADVRDFYQTVGDGFSLAWQSDADASGQPFAALIVPPLEDVLRTYTEWRDTMLYTPEKADAYGFPSTDDPALAKRTAARMWHWLSIIDEGNGDTLCIDLSDSDGPVIFNQHDWLDGGTGDNGHPLAANWRAFLIAWGSVCFQFPKDLYWPSCFHKLGGVDWNSDEFREPYRIPLLATY
jgi:cell wall assembly regulator SMI1